MDRCARLATGVLLAALSWSHVSQAQAVRRNAGFFAMDLGPTDDGSSDAVPLGFAVGFANGMLTEVYVSNNGYLAFGQPGGEQFTSTVFTQKLLAPFFADVDTRAAPSGTVHWGTDVVDGHAAFAATWPDVGYFMAHSDLLNTFQVVVVDRSDVKAGSFDVEMNYDSILWDCGDAECVDQGAGLHTAKVGHSDGVVDTLMPGSNQPGTFTNSNLATGLVHNSAGTTVLGRYIYPFRDALPDAGPGQSNQPSTKTSRGCQSASLGGLSVLDVPAGLVAVVAFVAVFRRQMRRGGTLAARNVK